MTCRHLNADGSCQIPERIMHGSIILCNGKPDRDCFEDDGDWEELRHLEEAGEQ